MIVKVNDVKRLNVGDKFLFCKDRVVQIQSIEGKKVVVIDIEDGTVINMEFFQDHGKSYRYRYDMGMGFCRGSGMNSRYGSSFGNMYDFGVREPIRAGEQIKFRVEGKDHQGVVAAVGSYDIKKGEITFNNKAAKNAIVVIANGVERVIIGCNQTLYFVEPDANQRMWINNTHICTIEGYRA
ncbi:hypothetical protein [Aeromonas phage phiWae14]|nr:hypothetical protein [Aeromonas phage phiWae14]